MVEQVELKDKEFKCPKMNEMSVRILFEKGKFTDFDKKSSNEVDVFKFEDRLRLQNHFNDFHERLYDLEDVQNKYEDLNHKQIEYQMNNTTVKPNINQRSQVFSLNKKT